MHTKTLKELAQGLRSGEFSSSELTQAFLNRIKQHHNLNAYITVTEEVALQNAKAADIRLASGKPELLTGIPIAQKDIFCTLNIKTTCGSKMLDNFTAPYNATVVEKVNQAGAVMLGKLNMDEFAMGSSNETSYYGVVKNPWNLQTFQAVHPADRRQLWQHGWPYVPQVQIPAVLYANLRLCAALPD